MPVNLRLTTHECVHA